jgi:cell wall-associated NlpC family hydrolase
MKKLLMSAVLGVLATVAFAAPAQAHYRAPSLGADAPTVATSKAPEYSSTPASATQSAIVQDAKRYLGTPYVFGSTDPSIGLDCSAFVQRVFADYGIEIPRLVRDQRYVGEEIASIDLAQPGDIFVYGWSPDTYHVVLYIGDDKVIHSPQPGEFVKISHIWDFNPTTIRRIV